MQFTHPELLWALFLLLIPILIHLFQLRRFQKIPFTNVAFLKKVVAESRRSNTLKKWLLLFTRLCMLAAIVLAFAQPFFADKSALKEKETVIYLDDSFSMQAKSEGATLLKNAVQSLIKAIPEAQTFTLFTNEKIFTDVSLSDIQNDLLALDHTPKQLKLNEIYLKANTFFNGNSETIKNLVLISDFQQRMSESDIDTSASVHRHLVQMIPETISNVSLDSIYFDNQTSENIELTALISSNSSIENIPVSLFNGEQLIAKTSAVFQENNKAKVSFTLPDNAVINGELEISDTGLPYDNHLYFNIDEKEKIKVLVVNGAKSDYLKRIYTDDEFQFSSASLRNLDYGNVASQNLIVLNELKSIPNTLTAGLKSFTDGGGNLAIVPSTAIDLNSYNLLLSNYFRTAFIQKVNVERNITDISFSHPLYRNVFAKNVTNFQYPKISNYYRVRTYAPTALLFQDKDPFLIGGDPMYLFTASISSENSNFKNSPLIVPTFYNIGSSSLRLSSLYNILGNTFSIDVPISLSKDHILKVSKEDYEFIPQQQALSNKVSLTFDEDFKREGIYRIVNGENEIKSVSFNHNRSESNLSFLNLEQLNATSKTPSIASLFETMEKDSRVTELWKWFAILALLFLLLEVLILKFFK